MTPTVFRDGPYRFHFFSREERRPHVHVASADGEAKFWLEPDVELARSHGYSRAELARIEAILRRRLEEVRDAWSRHFGA